MRDGEPGKEGTLLNYEQLGAIFARRGAPMAAALEAVVKLPKADAWEC